MSETMKTVEQLAVGLTMENACTLCLASAGLACMNLNSHRLMIRGDSINSIPQPVEKCKAYTVFKNGK